MAGDNVMLSVTTTAHLVKPLHFLLGLKCFDYIGAKGIDGVGCEDAGDNSFNDADNAAISL